MLESLGIKQCAICGKYYFKTHIVTVIHGKYTRYYCDACVANRTNRTINDVNGGKRNESKQENREH